MEEHFKNKLKNHKVDWEKTELLGNLQKELSVNNERSTRWIWFLLLPILLFSTCWGWNYLQTPASNNNISQLESNAGQIEIQNAKIENSTTSKIKIEAGATANVVESSNDKNRIKSADKITSKSNQSVSQLQQVINTNTTVNTLAQNLKPSLSNSSNESPIRSVAGGVQTSTISIVKEIISDQAKSSLNEDNIKGSTTKSNLINSTASLDTGDIHDKTTIDFMQLDPILRLRKNALYPKEQNENSTLAKMMDNFPPKDNFDSENEASLGNHFYFSGSSELGLVYRRRVFNVDGEELQSALEANEETERSLYIFSSNLFFGYQHDTNWSLQAGLEYNHVKEVFNYYEKVETMFVRDSINVFRTTERTVKHYNDYKFYSIPFQLAYQFDLKKAKLSTKLGASYTFTHSFKGRRNHIDFFGSGRNEIIEIFDDSGFDDFVLLDRIGIQAGLTLEYPFLNKHQFFTSATYRRSPTIGLRGVENLGSFLEQNFHSVSIGAGFRFVLGGKD